MSRSQRSFATHPAALVAKVPKTMTPTSSKGGVALAAKNTAHRAGIIKIKRPSGLSQRNSRIIFNQVGSELCCGAIGFMEKL